MRDKAKIAGVAILVMLIISFAIAGLYQAAESNDYKTILLKQGFTVSEIDDCMVWALGEGYGSLGLREVDDRWNERHSDIF